MNILLFGGAFDPAHKGHKQILQLAKNYEKWDKLIVIPTATPGHKEGCNVPYIIRKEFANITLSKVFCDIEFSDFEYLQLDKKSYSYLTLRHLKEKYPTAKFTFIIGQDHTNYLKEWKNYEEVIKNTSFLAFLRDEFDEDTKLNLEKLKADGVNINFIKNNPIVISSSEIRQEINSDKIKEYLDKDVLDLINKYYLYSKNDEKRLIGTIKLLLNLIMDKKRKVHTINVAQFAINLAEIHNVDIKKAEISALLHDINKRISEEEMLKRCYEGSVKDVDKNKPFKTLHGFAGADFAMRELKIFDEDILWAIKSHTCGRPNMSDLEKIIYLSDMLSKERQFLEKDELIKLSYENLDKAMLRGLELSMDWLLKANKDLDKDSLTAFEFYKTLVSKGEKSK